MAIRRNPRLEEALEARFSGQPESVITAAKFIANTLRLQRKLVNEGSYSLDRRMRNPEGYAQAQGRIAVEEARAEGAAFILDCVIPLPNEQPWLEAVQEVRPASTITNNDQ